MFKKKMWCVIAVLCLIVSIVSVSSLAAEDVPRLVNGYYEIYTADQLYWFAAQVNSGNTSINGKLMANIVVNENVLNADGTLNGDGSSFRVWTSIGNDYDHYYSGEFDGNGKTISGLYHNAEYSSNIGLFGYTEYDAVIKNVGILDSFLSGSSDIGAVVANNCGKVTNCYNAGVIVGTWIGGVVGHSNGIIERCYNVGKVSGELYVGGVVGYNSGTVRNCYNTGDVHSEDGYVGGVTGRNSYGGIINKCYNTGNVTCDASYDQTYGGIAGSNIDSVISNCYNVGNVTGNSFVGFEYSYDGGTISHSYNVVDWDTEYGYAVFISDCYEPNDDPYEDPYDDNYFTKDEVAEGELAYLLQCDQVVHVWGQKIDTDPYPVFSDDRVISYGVWFGNCYSHSYENGFCHWCGIEQAAELNGDVYEISNAGQLYWFAAKVDDGYSDINGKLMEDIVVNENVLNSDGTINGEGSDFRVWIPIGKDSEAPYMGSFDGNGKTISGLYYNDSSIYNVGLFGYLGDYDNTATVKNVGVLDSFLKGDSTVGGIVGLSWGTVRNCYNAGTVSGNQNVGGVVGDNRGIVCDCYNMGNVNGGEYYSGGVVGYNSYGTDMIICITNCFNAGSVNGIRNVGGVVGYAYNNYAVSNCYYLLGCAKDADGTIQFGVGTFTQGSSVADIPAATTGMTAGQFTSGEVAYLLQGDQTEQIWGQKIGTDAYPVFSDDKVYLNGGQYSNTKLCDHAYTYSYDSTNKLHNFTCTLCGETVTKTAEAKFGFNTASPALAVDIVMNIAVTMPAGFENPYMVVEFNGVTTTLTEYTVNAENGRYVFAFPGINPQTMGDTFHATLYAVVDGVQVGVELDYSMLKYINSQLKKAATPANLITALSDLVMYGEANQIYESYKTDALLSSLLEDAARANLKPSTFKTLSESYNKQTTSGTKNPNIDLKGVSLSLGSRVLVRVTVFCTDAQTHSVKATINGEEHVFLVSELPLADGYTDRYVLEFDQIRATQFGEEITFSFLDADGNQVGRTLTYTVYTYVQKNQNADNENLVNLLKAIYNYGESVKKI